MLARIAARRRSVNIAMVGKYTRLHDAYLSVVEALYHAGYENGRGGAHQMGGGRGGEPMTLRTMSCGSATAFWFPAALGTVGLRVWSMPPVMPARRAMPYFGICLGMQIAVIEYARSMLGYADANSS